MGVREVILECIFATGAGSEKKTTKIKDFQHFYCCFLVAFYVVSLRLAGGAGARAHLEKTGFRMEGVAFFACRPFARGAKKKPNDDENA